MVKIITIVLFIYVSKSYDQSLTAEVRADSYIITDLNKPIRIFYTIRNLSDSTIIFLNKATFYATDSCWKLSISPHSVFNPVKLRTIEDFIILNSGEEKEIYADMYLHNLCRIQKEVTRLNVSYRALITEDENYYFSDSANGKVKNFLVNAFSGEIESEFFELTFKRGDK
ncbi:MAG: hypothetical protein N2510_09120 [Ignavibacteria bacterium]|nr:hypothetical protein [Ignavibacteria bacterium]